MNKEKRTQIINKMLEKLKNLDLSVIDSHIIAHKVYPDNSIGFLYYEEPNFGYIENKKIAEIKVIFKDYFDLPVTEQRDLYVKHSSYCISDAIIKDIFAEPAIIDGHTRAGGDAIEAWQSAMEQCFGKIYPLIMQSEINAQEIEELQTEDKENDNKIERLL